MSEQKSNPKLIAGCKLWDKVTTKAHQFGYKIPMPIKRYGDRTIYADGDYQMLQCRITGDIAELTVGASTGHKAKIDLAKKRLDYFDPRGDNNRKMWEILNNVVKLKCKRDDTGVHCTGITSKPKLNNTFKALSMPTSMDFRSSHCNNFNSLTQCIQSEKEFFQNGPFKEKP